MARGIRKTAKQKLEEQLSEVRKSIMESRDFLRKLEEKEEELIVALEQEELKALSVMLKENNMSPGEVMELLFAEPQQA